MSPGELPLNGLLVVLLIIVLAAIPLEIQRRRDLREFLVRTCTGTHWKERFPGVSNKDVHIFLLALVGNFSVYHVRKLKFEPDVRVIELFRALNPGRHNPTAWEMALFVRKVGRHCRLDLSATAHERLTLGQLFEMTRGNKNAR